MTESLPIGIWQLYECDYQKGDIVLFDPPDCSAINNLAKNKQYLVVPSFIKIIVSTEGDFVKVNMDSIELSTGIKLPLLEGVETVLQGGVIPKNSYFVSTPKKRSLDSRYFGLIDRESFKSCARLVYEF